MLRPALCVARQARLDQPAEVPVALVVVALLSSSTQDIEHSRLKVVRQECPLPTVVNAIAPFVCLVAALERHNSGPRPTRVLHAGHAGHCSHRSRLRVTSIVGRLAGISSDWRCLGARLFLGRRQNAHHGVVVSAAALVGLVVLVFAVLLGVVFVVMVAVVVVMIVVVVVVVVIVFVSDGCMY